MQNHFGKGNYYELQGKFFLSVLVFKASSAANLLAVHWFLWPSAGMSLILFGMLDNRGWLEGAMSAGDGVAMSDPVV